MMLQKVAALYKIAVTARHRQIRGPREVSERNLSADVSETRSMHTNFRMSRPLSSLLPFLKITQVTLDWERDGCCVEMAHVEQGLRLALDVVFSPGQRPPHAETNAITRRKL
jgi:hypothetical protein